MTAQIPIFMVAHNQEDAVFLADTVRLKQRQSWAG